LFAYTAYELGIHSEIPLPGLKITRNPAEDVFVRLRALANIASAGARSASSFLGETPGVATFLVRDGKEIIVDPAPAGDVSILCTILLGPILAVLLRQRGLAVIHASGVTINGRAVAFVGQSGWGKSTIAEAFYKRGYGVITDDVMAVSIGEKCPEVLPGYPSIKLFPDSARFLQCEDSTTHKVNSQTEKRAHSVACGFPQGRRRLRRMYILSNGDSNIVAPLHLQEVFVELVRNSRAITLLNDAQSLNAHLNQCSRLAAEVPAFRLKRLASLASLPGVVQMIEEHLAQCN
jgi:hypothetical protein